MLILAFDTTNEHGGAGLFRDSQCLAMSAHEGPPDYSVTLFQEVAALLAKANVQFAEVDLIAAANGPGSFTGIRVGIAAAQGWASTFNRPMRGVSVLEAMVDEAHPDTPKAAAIMDARRGEFYCAVFRLIRPSSSNSGPAFEAETDGFVLKAQELPAFLQPHGSEQNSLTCVVRENDEAARSLQGTLPASYLWRVVQGTLVPAIARVAVRSYGEKRPPSPNELYAYYIRHPDVEANWKG
ncbi:MAG TPA: tRNA (adenosine(37)-N6)-threonylcarbamoyltransferase complex dimerization subunit type 1 TsaB [Terriglobia bacterium]|nr:tRNA (adenosine(37)-N6)-threonylcarbamoyltransferase complex dimerization subunit type 1 TsaB [Terriglobia bacterium]